jgi:hypothetical protein
MKHLRRKIFFESPALGCDTLPMSTFVPLRTPTILTRIISTSVIVAAAVEPQRSIAQHAITLDTSQPVVSTLDIPLPNIKNICPGATCLVFAGIPEASGVRRPAAALRGIRSRSAVVVAALKTVVDHLAIDYCHAV